MNNRVRVQRAVSAAVLLATPTFALAGGGGQNMLLLVDPTQESSLRMANAYAAARNIPDRNIVFVETPRAAGYPLLTIHNNLYTSTYRDAIPAVITARGLSSQVDYIGNIGQPQSVWGTAPNSSGTNVGIRQSFTYMQSMNTQFTDGLTYPSADFRLSELYQTRVPSGATAVLPYTENTNAAIRHSTEYALRGVGAPGQTTAQWYMAGNVGYSGTHAITAEKWVERYPEIAAADGTKPVGKIYYMENDNIRSDTREPYWPAVQAYMTAHGIAWEEIVGSSPVNKPDVNGAIIGSANYLVPNGSTFNPGSFIDSVTSNAGGYTNSAHTKIDKVIAAGAAGTSGAITEPFAIADRFPDSILHVYSAEGSTLGEAWFKSVARPDLMQFEGDLLSQPHADMPAVTMSAPTAASGSISVTAGASLISPRLATGIARMKLLVDGLEVSTIPSASGTFTLDTTALSDGRHELRVVAENNAAAESQGYAISHVTVNNRGQVVSTTGNTFTANATEIVSVPVSAMAGTDTVSRVELRSLGRVVGTLPSATGSVSLDAKKLAFGTNTVVPVAIMAGGAEVAGAPITVDRQFNKINGRNPTRPVDRVAGLKFEHFTGVAGNTLADTNFNVTPNHTNIGSTLIVEPDSANPARVNMPAEYLGGNNAGLGIRVTGSFNATLEGEYGFFFDVGNANYESLQLSVDRITLAAHEFWNGTTFNSQSYTQGANTQGTIFLKPGEHDLQLLLGNPQSNTDDRLTLVYWMKDPLGKTMPIDSSLFYVGTRLPGDADNDGDVDVTDLGILAANFRMMVANGPDGADFDNSGLVDVSDLGILAANFRAGTTTFAAAAASFGLPNVPEPATASLLIVPALLMRRRR